MTRRFRSWLQERRFVRRYGLSRDAAYIAVHLERERIATMMADIDRRLRKHTDDGEADAG